MVNGDRYRNALPLEWERPLTARERAYVRRLKGAYERSVACYGRALDHDAERAALRETSS